jgi:alpha-L-fucosidase
MAVLDILAGNFYVAPGCIAEVSMLKTDPKYGYFPRWPQDGDQWLHPEDIELARRLIPSMRIFQRDGTAGDLVLLHYGDLTLRARPALWQVVSWEGFDLGDWVEVLTRVMQNPPHTGTIREMLWDQRHRQMRYQLQINGQPSDRFFSADDLRHIEPVDR